MDEVTVTLGTQHVLMLPPVMLAGTSYAIATPLVGEQHYPLRTIFKIFTPSTGRTFTLFKNLRNPKLKKYPFSIEIWCEHGAIFRYWVI
jgi:hypothetical protein